MVAGDTNALGTLLVDAFRLTYMTGYLQPKANGSPTSAPVR
jgi:hypothetical protein